MSGRTRSLGAAYAMPWRAAPILTGGQLLVTVAAGVAPVTAAWLLRALLDSLATRHTAGLVPVAVGLAAVGAAGAVLPYVSQYLTAQAGRSVQRLATQRLFSAVGNLAGLRRLEDPAFLDKLNLAQRVSMAGPGQAFDSTVTVVQAALTMTGFLAGLFVLSPFLTLILLGASLPGVLVEVSLARRRAVMLANISQAERRQSFYANLLSSLPAAKEIRLFGLGSFFRGRMIAELRDIHQSSERVDRRQAWALSALALMGGLIAGGGLLWAASAAVAGRLTVGDVALFLAALTTSSSALGSIITSGGMAYQAVLTFQSYLDVVGGGDDLPMPARPVPAAPLRHGIEFDDVWFRYSPDTPWVLRGVNLFIPRGQTMAVIGLNGAGKSTLVKLMCRFYDPDRGRVLWDGVDLRELDLAGLRDRVSAVFQDYMAYELSAWENIAVGDLGRAADASAVTAAARRAGIHDRLTALPKGYRTLLTRTYTDLEDRDDPQTGVLLSGGQWQRIALARALMRSGRDLVVLDEPSSGLDPEAENEIHALLRQYREGVTTIMISHRLNTTRHADTIVVLANGEIAEAGGHGPLMARGGTYARLFTMQSQGFATMSADYVVNSS